MNRKSIVDYAYRYWNNYNFFYRKYERDCTNFVSQALRAGGWPFAYNDGFFDYQSDNVWWYHWLGATWTWAGAQNFSKFIQNQKRAYLAGFLKDLQLGDILQMDMDKNGNIDHSMIVTKKRNDELMLTDHTKNTLDRSINEILREFPITKTAYYGWRLYDSW